MPEQVENVPIFSRLCRASRTDEHMRMHAKLSFPQNRNNIISRWNHTVQVVHKSPPLFRIPNFLTPEDCDALIQAAIEVREQSCALTRALFTGAIEFHEADLNRIQESTSAISASECSCLRMRRMRLDV